MKGMLQFLKIGHAVKLLHFAHRFQNYFCFCSWTFPSHVVFFDFNGKLAEKSFFRNKICQKRATTPTLQPSSQLCWATFLIFFSGIPHLPIFVAYGLMAINDQIWPNLAIWPQDHMWQIWANEVSLKRSQHSTITIIVRHSYEQLPSKCFQVWKAA